MSFVNSSYYLSTRPRATPRVRARNRPGEPGLQTMQGRCLLGLSISLKEADSALPVWASGLVFMTCVLVGPEPRKLLASKEGLNAPEARPRPKVLGRLLSTCDFVAGNREMRRRTDEVRGLGRRLRGSGLSTQTGPEVPKDSPAFRSLRASRADTGWGQEVTW